MFFAKATDNSNLTLYVSMLNKLVAGNNDYEPLFKDVVINSHQLAANEISFYQIKPEIFEIVQHLNNTNSAYFKDLHVDNIDNSTYQTILGILRTSLPMPC